MQHNNLNNEIQLNNCSYNLSLELKNLGFLVYCPGKYYSVNPPGFYKSNSFVPNERVYNLDAHDYMIFGENYKSEDCPIVLAPVHEIAAKWILTNFRIGVSVNVGVSGHYYLDMWKIKEDAARGWEKISFIGSFPTHYEAMEVGLMKAVEMVKEKLTQPMSNEKV